MSLYSTLLEKTALRYVLGRDGLRSAPGHLRRLKESQFWTREKLLESQAEQLRRLLDHAYRTCPYYTRLLDERGLKPESFRTVEDLKRLPVLTKQLVFDHTDDILSSRYDRSELLKFSSGGTTGQQTTMFIDRESIAIKMAAQWRFEGWFGISPCDKLAILWPPAMDLEEHPPFKTRIKDRYIWRNLVLNLGMSSEARMMEFYEQVTKFQPRFIKTFPVCLMQFAELIESKALPLPKVEAILSTGEPLYAELRARIEESFGCPVFDVYASREVGHTSAQCSEHEGLHIAMETSVVEFLNDGVPAGPGESGELFITDLTNYAFPLIRYEINDYGRRLDEPCRCGRGLTRMSAGVGRLVDDFVGLDGRRHSSHALAVHLTADLAHRIGQVQMIQRDRTDILVRLTDNPKPTEETYEFLRNTIRAIIGEGIEIEFEVVDKIPRERSGKTRFFICQVPRERS